MLPDGYRARQCLVCGKSLAGPAFPENLLWTGHFPGSSMFSYMPMRGSAGKTKIFFSLNRSRVPPVFLIACVANEHIWKVFTTTMGRLYHSKLYLTV